MVGPNYKRPNVNAPAAFRGASGAAQQSSFADLPWWEVFKDETLKELIKTSLANNYDLAAAVARVEQARQIAADSQIAILSGHQLHVDHQLWSQSVHRQPCLQFGRGSRILSGHGQRNLGGRCVGPHPPHE